MGNDILITLNEIKQQLANLSFDPGSGETGATEVINQIATNIEAMRATLEARSVAETTAQNTNFSDLIAALQDGCLTKYITIQRGACGGGGGIVGTEAPSESGTEFDTPPGYFEPTDETPGSGAYYSRKCKMANALAEDLRGYFEALEDEGVDSLESAASLVVLTTLVGLGFGELSTPIPILDGAVGTVIGFIAGIALDLFLLLGELDFHELTDAMDANNDDLVCALYEAETGTQAIDDYVQVLEDDGTTSANLLAVRAVFWVDVANNLFFKSQEAIEASIQTYIPPNDCSGCASTCENRLATGDNFLDTGSQISADSVPSSGSNFCSVYIDTTELLSHCGGTVTVSNFVTTAGTIDQSGQSNDAYRIHSPANPPGPGEPGDLYSHKTDPPPTPIAGAAYIVLKSKYSFSVQFDYTVDQ